jgi:hypothetical protein
MTPITNALTLAGVTTCLVAVFVAVFVIPRLAPFVFIVGCCVLLGFALWMHWSEFGRDEYRTSSIRYTIKNSASLVLIGLVIAGLIGFYFFNSYNQMSAPEFSMSSPANTTPASSLFSSVPSAPTSMTTIGGGLKSAVKHVVSRVKHMMRNI